MRFAKNRQSHARELVVSLGRNEPVSSKKLRRAIDSVHESLLPLRSEQGRRPGTLRLFYDVSGLTSLKGYVRRTRLDGEDLLAMMTSIVEALAWCGLDGNGRFSMLFDSPHVFVGVGGGLHFAYLPLAGTSDIALGSPLTVLGVLGESDKLSFSSPNACEISRSIARFMLDSDGVFSLNALRRFARQLGGCMQVPYVKPSSLKLRCVRTGRTYDLAEGCVLRMGRATSCDVRVMDNPGISREHARISLREGAVALWDVGSKNGTMYEGHRLRPNECVNVSLGGTFFLDTEAFCVCE